ncbi:MAG TPA: three-Cys-motif partner protein TcmP [Burkholderiales bacterium]|nr:three-Cys-motif partner protein TcmP [Burkholderiales bacterium]
MSANKGVIWPAEPHTIAKIEMLRAYLYQWFSILGRRFEGKDLWYVDGCAGPGEYTNYQTGSPLAAMDAAQATLRDAAGRWRANKIHCVFVEENEPRFQHLEQKLAGIPKDSRIPQHLFRGTFANGVAWLREQTPNPFASEDPIFAFIDPFGPSGLSFSAVKEFLGRPSCEVLINLDSDGISRIKSAGEYANHRTILNETFGDSDWEGELTGVDQAEIVQRALALYKKKLRALPGVRYAFSFEMRKRNHAFDYHLVFASHHPKGLEKMKEVMKRLDQNGTYCFSDDHVGQHNLFAWNDPTTHAADLQRHFAGCTVPYSDVNDYALNDSPFINPKAMLKALESAGNIRVQCTRARRKGTFPDDAHDGMMITFEQGLTNG